MSGVGSGSLFGSAERYKTREVIRTTRDPLVGFEQQEGPPSHSIETAAEKKLKELVTKQLDTTAGRAREAEPIKFVAVHEKQKEGHSGGLVSLEQFKARKERDLGGGTDADLKLTKKRRIAHPDFLKKEQEHNGKPLIHVEEHKKKDSKLSRHQMEIERSLLVGKRHIPLAHLFLEEEDPQLLTNKEDTQPHIKKATQGDKEPSEQVAASPENVTTAVKTVVLHEQPASIPEEEIRKHKMTVEEIWKLPHSKNYKPGTPSKVLYIKNLSKKVTQDDLLALFIRFQHPDKPQLLFKLTGRPQAFVTFPGVLLPNIVLILADVETAQAAFELANGYSLKNRPMIIEYGRTA